MVISVLQLIHLLQNNIDLKVLANFLSKILSYCAEYEKEYNKVILEFPDCFIREVDLALGCEHACHGVHHGSKKGAEEEFELEGVHPHAMDRIFQLLTALDHIGIDDTSCNHKDA